MDNYGRLKIGFKIDFGRIHIVSVISVKMFFMVLRFSVTTKGSFYTLQVYIKEFFINGILKSFTPLWIDSDIDIANDPYTTDCSGQTNGTNPHAYTKLKIVNGELTSSNCIEKPPGKMILKTDIQITKKLRKSL